jgi:uncharacterized protein YegP (UPF0339 family)
MDNRWTDSKWQGNKWEFYKDSDGLWHWRTVVPEGWDPIKGEWKAGSWQSEKWGNGKQQTQSNPRDWDWSQEGVNWIELARSPEGYKNKTECEANARKFGWS